MIAVEFTGLDIHDTVRVGLVQDKILKGQGVVAEHDDFREPAAGLDGSQADGAAPRWPAVGMEDILWLPQPQRQPAGRARPAPFLLVMQVEDGGGTNQK